MTEPMRPHPVLKNHYTAQDQHPIYVRALFNATARHYAAVNRLFSLNSGAWYRRRALRLAGLRPGMRLLDIATGTGLVVEAALRLTNRQLDVIGLDISENMLAEARQLRIPLIQGRAEQLPVDDASIDFISMGYALRHVADLATAFAAFWQALRPDGTLLLLEIARGSGRFQHACAAFYFGWLLPLLCRLAFRRTPMHTLMCYHWDTIQACVAPDVILAQLAASGFVEVRCVTELDLFRAYVARKPASRIRIKPVE